MSEEQSSLNEAVDVGSSAISHLKILKSTSALLKGGAIGGPFGAVIGAAFQHKKVISRIGIILFTFLFLQVAFIIMLPGLVFESLTQNTGA